MSIKINFLPSFEKKILFFFNLYLSTNRAFAPHILFLGQSVFENVSYL